MITSNNNAKVKQAPKFLMSIQNNYPTVEIGPNDVSEGYSQFTLGGALALGYDFNSQFGVPVRAEVEYALRGNSEKSWNYDKILDLKGAWNASTLFLNLYYDFRNSTAFLQLMTVTNIFAAVIF